MQGLWVSHHSGPGICVGLRGFCRQWTRSEQRKEDKTREHHRACGWGIMFYLAVLPRAWTLSLREESGDYGLMQAECPASRMGYSCEKQVTRMTQEGVRLCP